MEHLGYPITRLHELIPDKKIWLIDNLIREKTVTLITGEPGSFKTWIIEDIGLSVAKGIPWLERKTLKRETTLFELDGDAEIIHERGLMLSPKLTSNFLVWGSWQEEPPPLWDREGIEWYCEYASKHEPLFIFDPMRDFHGGKEGDSDSMGPIMKAVNKIKKAGATIIIVHHQGKSEFATYRGSEAIKASCDYMWNIKVTKETVNNDGTEIRMKGIKNRMAAKFDIDLIYRCTDNRAWFEDKTRLQDLEEAAKVQSKIMYVRELLSRNMINGIRLNQSQLVDMLHGTDSFGGKNKTLNFIKRWEDTHWRVARGEKHALFYEVVYD